MASAIDCAAAFRLENVWDEVVTARAPNPKTSDCRGGTCVNEAEVVWQCGGQTFPPLALSTMFDVVERSPAAQVLHVMLETKSD